MLNAIKNKSKSGAALGLVILFIVIFLIIGGAMLAAATANARASIINHQINLYQNAAESALQIAAQEFNRLFATAVLDGFNLAIENWLDGEFINGIIEDTPWNDGDSNDPIPGWDDLSTWDEDYGNEYLERLAEQINTYALAPGIDRADKILEALGDIYYDILPSIDISETSGANPLIFTSFIEDAELLTTELATGIAEPERFYSNDQPYIGAMRFRQLTGRMIYDSISARHELIIPIKPYFTLTAQAQNTTVQASLDVVLRFDFGLRFNPGGGQIPTGMAVFEDWSTATHPELYGIGLYSDGNLDEFRRVVRAMDNLFLWAFDAEDYGYQYGESVLLPPEEIPLFPDTPRAGGIRELGIRRLLGLPVSEGMPVCDGWHDCDYIGCDGINIWNGGFLAPWGTAVMGPIDIFDRRKSINHVYDPDDLDNISEDINRGVAIVSAFTLGQLFPLDALNQHNIMVVNQHITISGANARFDSQAFSDLPSAIYWLRNNENWYPTLDFMYIDGALFEGGSDLDISVGYFPELDGIFVDGSFNVAGNVSIQGPASEVLCEPCCGVDADECTCADCPGFGGDRPLTIFAVGTVTLGSAADQPSYVFNISNVQLYADGSFSIYLPPGGKSDFGNGTFVIREYLRNGHTGEGDGYRPIGNFRAAPQFITRGK
ncbi:MAG: hypothetical protein LBE35_08260, partial [Clostridiales bacterium]|nr:hypothetical protein [Clostridiales bacterium]